MNPRLKLISGRWRKLSIMKKTRHKTNILVTKASGVVEEFSIAKLRASLSRAGASAEETNRIISKVIPALYDGIRTKELYIIAFKLLKASSKPKASRFHLKKGIMELGPSGFPFEIL